MQADHQAYAKAHGVLAMPKGYDPVQQVLVNRMLNYWIPTYRNGVLAGLVALMALLVHQRQGRRTVG